MATPFDNFISAANKVYHHVVATSHSQTEEEQLVRSIDSAYKQWQNAEARFNEATDPDLIDHAIYDMLSAKTQYSHLIRTAKTKGVSR